MKKKMRKRDRRAGKQKSKRERRAADLERVLTEGGKIQLEDGLTLEVASIEDKTLLEILEVLD